MDDSVIFGVFFDRFIFGVTPCQPCPTHVRGLFQPFFTNAWGQPARMATTRKADGAVT